MMKLVRKLWKTDKSNTFFRVMPPVPGHHPCKPHQSSICVTLSELKISSCCLIQVYFYAVQRSSDTLIAIDDKIKNIAK